MNHPKYNVLNAAYLYFYGTTVGLEEGADEDGRLTKRLEELVGDALIIADQAKFDVFNALTLMDNVCFLQDLKVRLLLSPAASTMADGAPVRRGRRR